MNNRIIFYICVFLSLCFSSCELDNYDAPDAQLFGRVIDDETNEPILQDMGEGSRIDFIESGYPDIRQIRFHTDGSFRENNLFSGTYDVQAVRGNFFPAERQTIEIKGATEHNFRTLPYIRIHNVTMDFNEIRGIVTGTFTLEQIASDPVKSIDLFADVNLNVSKSIQMASKSKEINTTVTPEQTFKLELSTENLVSGRDYYFRVGALISGIGEAKHNYSQAIRLPIDNSQVIPDAPIPGKVIDACESLSGWAGSGLTISLDGDDKKEGSYSLRATGAGPTIVLQKKFEQTFDTEVTRADGYMAFDMYVSDVSLFGTNQFELTSSGGPDVEEVNWTVPEMNLVNGWNRVELSLAKAPAAVNLRAVNFIRFYDVALKGNIVLKFDNIRFYTK